MGLPLHTYTTSYLDRHSHTDLASNSSLASESHIRQWEMATPEGNFVILCQRLLDALSSMIKDARDNKLSDIDPSKLDSTRKMLTMAVPANLVKAFIEKEAYWKKIENRDMLFLEKELGVIFQEAQILNAELVTEPVRVYILLKDWKEKPETRPAAPIASKKVPMDYDKPFLNDEDINGIWSKLKLMIKMSCKWNANNGNKYDLSAYSSYLA